MRFENDSVIAYLNNEKEMFKDMIIRYRPGTVITFAKICKRARGYVVNATRNKVGQKVKPEKLRFKDYEEARNFVEQIYGV